jgi:hypothetical protein
MPDNRVVIQYQQAVPRAPGVRRRFVGETYTVTDAATAEAVHPGAKITKYADGRKFVRTQDESLAAVREAEARAAEKEAAKAAKMNEAAAKAAANDKPSGGSATAATGAKQG